ncbi:MAG: transporter ATP-binding protein [Actinomycetia bacterium]|nr:transporter ATP-binding protein [Actinomycetes bacterium]
MPAPEPVVRCRGVGATYGAVPALVDVDADFAAGRLSVVAGPSGSGKSTLLRVLAGLHHGTGSVVVDGTELRGLRTGQLRRLRRRRIGFVLQSPADNLVEHLTALQQVQLAARLRGIDGAGAEALLDAVGLGGRMLASPAELSGGEQHRVAFAAGAIGPPTVLLADEPTAQLDSTSGAALVEAMRRLVQRGTTLVVSSHDPMVIDAADHAVHLRDGRVVEP